MEAGFCTLPPWFFPNGSGVIFNGSIDRFFALVTLLWETRLSDLPTNAAISYAVNGKQYLAVGVGKGGAQAPPAVWVFQLP